MVAVHAAGQWAIGPHQACGPGGQGLEVNPGAAVFATVEIGVIALGPAQ